MRSNQLETYNFPVIRSNWISIHQQPWNRLFPLLLHHPKWQLIFKTRYNQITLTASSLFCRNRELGSQADNAIARPTGKDINFLPCIRCGNLSGKPFKCLKSAIRLKRDNLKTTFYQSLDNRYHLNLNVKMERKNG